MAKEKDKKKIGAPSVYTQELADKLCLEIATSNKSLKTICKELSIGASTVLKWLNTNEHKGFVEQYARAKEEQADYLVEEMLEIADDSSNDTMTIEGKNGPIEVENKEWTSRSKLRVDTRKWIASKFRPKKYGDKIELDNKITGDIKVTLNLE